MNTKNLINETANVLSPSAAAAEEGDNMDREEGELSEGSFDQEDQQLKVQCLIQNKINLCFSHFVSHPRPPSRLIVTLLLDCSQPLVQNQVCSLAFSQGAQGLQGQFLLESNAEEKQQRLILTNDSLIKEMNAFRCISIHMRISLSIIQNLYDQEFNGQRFILAQNIAKQLLPIVNLQISQVKQLANSHMLRGDSNIDTQITLNQLSEINNGDGEEASKKDSAEAGEIDEDNDNDGNKMKEQTKNDDISKVKQKNGKIYESKNKTAKIEKDYSSGEDSAEEIIKNNLKALGKHIGKYNTSTTYVRYKHDLDNSSYNNESYNDSSYSSRSSSTPGSLRKQKRMDKKNQKNNNKSNQDNVNNETGPTKKKNKKNKQKKQKNGVQQNSQHQQNKQKQDEFYTTKQAKRQKTSLTPYLSKDLCKFFLTGNCHRPSDCSFSHNTQEFPCKYLHGTGFCDKGTGCRFSHNLLNSEEIQKFIAENEEFLNELLQKTGKTNLGDYFIIYLKNKAEKEINAQIPKNVMLPSSMTPSVAAHQDFQGRTFQQEPQNNFNAQSQLTQPINIPAHNQFPLIKAQQTPFQQQQAYNGLPQGQYPIQQNQYQNNYQQNQQQQNQQYIQSQPQSYQYQQQIQQPASNINYPNQQNIGHLNNQELQHQSSPNFQQPLVQPQNNAQNLVSQIQDLLKNSEIIKMLPPQLQATLNNQIQSQSQLINGLPLQNQNIPQQQAMNAQPQTLLQNLNQQTPQSQQQQPSSYNQHQQVQYNQQPVVQNLASVLTNMLHQQPQKSDQQQVQSTQFNSIPNQQPQFQQNSPKQQQLNVSQSLDPRLANLKTQNQPQINQQQQPLPFQQPQANQPAIQASFTNQQQQLPQQQYSLQQLAQSPSIADIFNQAQALSTIFQQQNLQAGAQISPIIQQQQTPQIQQLNPQQWQQNYPQVQHLPQQNQLINQNIMPSSGALIANNQPVQQLNFEQQKQQQPLAQNSQTNIQSMHSQQQPQQFLSGNNTESQFVQKQIPLYQGNNQQSLQNTQSQTFLQQPFINQQQEPYQNNINGNFQQSQKQQDYHLRNQNGLEGSQFQAHFGHSLPKQQKSKLTEDLERIQDELKQKSLIKQQTPKSEKKSNASFDQVKQNSPNKFENSKIGSITNPNSNNDGLEDDMFGDDFFSNDDNTKGYNKILSNNSKGSDNKNSMEEKPNSNALKDKLNKSGILSKPI